MGAGGSIRAGWEGKLNKLNKPSFNGNYKNISTLINMTECKNIEFCLVTSQTTRSHPFNQNFNSTVSPCEYQAIQYNEEQLISTVIGRWTAFF